MNQFSTYIFAFFFLTLANLANADIEVVDDIGRTVIMKEGAKRIISLAPHITENLFSAGLGDRIVGAVSYSDYPEQAKALPLIGSYNNLNIELIFAARPDLIIAWKEGNQKQQVEKLMAMGLNVYVNNPETLEDIAKSIRHFGILADKTSLANSTSQSFLEKLAALASQYSNKRQISIFYQAWNQPLLTVNSEQSIGRIIKLCGGRNIFADLSGLTPQVSIEAVLAGDPAAIVASGMDESRPEWLDDWRRWKSLQAVQEERLFFVPPDIIQRHSVRILQGAEKICRALQQVRDAGNIN